MDTLEGSPCMIRDFHKKINTIKCLHLFIFCRVCTYFSVYSMHQATKYFVVSSLYYYWAQEIFKICSFTRDFHECPRLEKWLAASFISKCLVHCKWWECS